MNRQIIIILISLLSLNVKSQDFCDFIQSVQDYQDSVKLKHTGDSDILDSRTFDIIRYLSFYDNIVIEKDYKIEVCYFDNFLDGNPYLYAIKNNENFYDKNKESLYAILNQPDKKAINHVSPKDSKLGYLQFLFFYEMGEQFALKWHSNYDEKRIVCSKDKLNTIISELTISDMFSADSIGLIKLKDINPAILIDYDDKYYNISWIEYRTHAGIFQCSYQIERNGSYEIKKTSEIKLLEIFMNFIY